jgi:hypothetical protein
MDSQNSSNKTWYIIGVVVVVALALWYFSSSGVSPSANTGPTAVEQTQTSPDTTTAAISSDLNQIPDDTAALDQAAVAAAAAVQAF